MQDESLFHSESVKQSLKQCKAVTKNALEEVSIWSEFFSRSLINKKRAEQSETVSRVKTGNTKLTYASNIKLYQTSSKALQSNIHNELESCFWKQSENRQVKYSLIVWSLFWSRQTSERNSKCQMLHQIVCKQPCQLSGVWQIMSGFTFKPHLMNIN